MSDTTETENDPNFSAERVTRRINGKDKPGLRFTFGTPPRTITTIDLSLGDQLNLIEVAGDAATNPRWMMLAGFAGSIYEIDGVPLPGVSNKREAQDLLDKVAEEGWLAYVEAARITAKPKAQAAAKTETAAKNS